MHYGRISCPDIANGTGVRVAIFVSGCTNHCDQCFQPQTWDFNYGELYTQETEDMIMEKLKGNYITGLTILGGEPMELQNQEELYKLAARVKAECPQKTVWCYTGFRYEDLLPGGKRHGDHTDEFLDHIDVLVDGRFEIAKKDIRLKFRGSSNQRLIDMRRTRNSGIVVELD